MCFWWSSNSADLIEFIFCFFSCCVYLKLNLFWTNSSPPGNPGLWQKTFEQSSSSKSSNLESLVTTTKKPRKFFKMKIFLLLFVIFNSKTLTQKLKVDSCRNKRKYFLFVNILNESFSFIHFQNHFHLGP